MTMLDRMRRHKAWLKWSLAIVVVAFVLLYVPSFLTPAGVGAAPSDVVATVEGREITVRAYQVAYQQQVGQLQGAYGDQINEQLLRQLGIAQQVVQQLIDEEAVLAEADRLGVTVNDGELRSRIVRIPGFQEDGRFIGTERYRQILASQRPPLRESEFERQLRQALVAEKLQGAVTDWIQVSAADVEEEYRRRNERVQLELATFTADRFREGVEPTDEEITVYFAANVEDYRVPEKRRVRYLSIDAEALRNTMTTTPQEVEARYRQNLQTYSTPEQVRARHILFSTEEADEAEVRAEAEAVLEQARGGGDFEALAREHSDDASNAPMGGDLDYFGRGAMVPEFENAAFALEPGEISDLVQTPYGFHIIKVEDKRAAMTRPLDEVRVQLEDQIKIEKAQAEAQRLADDVAGQVDSPSDLDAVASARGLAVGDSGLFTRDEPLAGLGFAPAVAAEAFTMEVGDVSEMLRTNQGYAFITLTEIAPSALPALEDVGDTVREDVITAQALDRARERAAAVAEAGGAGFARAARAAGVDVKSTELITRGSVLPDVGASTAVDEAVFAVERGEVTPPIETPDAIVVARVVERGEIDQATFEEERQGLRTQLLQQRRNEFFSAYMSKAKQRMRIQFNDDTIRTILAG
jgi:peptidyl-prolyl cis-trans isomerase D